MPLIHNSPELRDMHEKMKAGTWRMYWEPSKGVLVTLGVIVAAGVAWLLFG